jgi:hypothetical protein
MIMGFFVAQRYFFWVPYHRIQLNFIESIRGVMMLVGGLLILAAEDYENL